MARSPRFWFLVAILFVLVNLAGAGMAVAGGEVQHTAVHVVLAIVGMLAAFALGARRGDATNAVDDELAEPEMSDRLANLERSVDAVAIEVERIGEGQRFMTRRFAEKAGQPRDAQPRETAPPDDTTSR